MQGGNRNIIVGLILITSFLVVPRASAAWFCFAPDPNPPHTIFIKLRSWLQPYFNKYPCTTESVEGAKDEQVGFFSKTFGQAKELFSGVKKWGGLLANLLEKLGT